MAIAYMSVRIAEQNEKFAQLLVKHFYTNDEIDRELTHHATKEDLKGFATKQELRETKEELKSYIGVQVESLRSDCRAGLCSAPKKQRRKINKKSSLTKKIDKVASYRWQI